MSQTCAIVSCKHVSRALCYCCQQSVCIHHLNEHTDLLNAQLNPLVNEINTLGNRFETLNIENIADYGHQKLEQWRINCHKKIDQIFQQKSEELDQLIKERVDKQREEISQVQSKLTELIREQDATSENIDLFTSKILQLEKEMNSIERRFVEVNTRLLAIDDTLILITKTNEREIDLSTLSPVYRTVNRPEKSFRLLATNDRFLLMHREPNLCIVDQELNIVNQTLWPYEKISDICWSSTLNRFVVVEESKIFLIDESTMSIDNLKAIEERKWASCTCSDVFLFLSTKNNPSSIVKFNISPLIEKVKEWKSPDTCTKGERISDMVHNNGMLALLIMNGFEKTIRMELRSAESLSRIWSFQLDTIYNQLKPFRCCSLTFDEWLVMDHVARRLLHITKDGKVKATITYDATPFRAALFGPNMLAISRKGGINFHQL